MDFLAELVDAAIGEHGAAQQRIGLLEIEVSAELPRQDAVVPVAADVGDVAVLLGRHDEGELGPVLRGSRRRVCGAIATPSAPVVPVHTRLCRSA